MGLFDTIILNCGHCGQKTQAQTKLTEYPSMNDLFIGDYLAKSLGSTYLELKENCSHCNKSIVIKVKQGFIDSVVSSGNATLREGVGGQIEVVDNQADSQDKQVDNQE